MSRNTRLKTANAEREPHRKEVGDHHRQSECDQRRFEHPPAHRRHRRIQLLKWNRQPQNECAAALVRKTYSYVAEVSIQRGTVPDRDANLARISLPNFRPVGMVLHGLGIVLRIGQHGAFRVNDGHARLRTRCGLFCPFLQFRRGNRGRPSGEDARLHREPVLHALRFPLADVSREEGVQYQERRGDQNESADEEFAE